MLFIVSVLFHSLCTVIFLLFMQLLLPCFHLEMEGVVDLFSAAQFIFICDASSISLSYCGVLVCNI
jgi:hypothetical protein